ncbi:Alpha/Beta hydrolase protein [Stachybotrys elegans]|uniref:Alpha/Beta hydrolase protein n=1 Tax=Stachybotrys elegans TaxID=80388 RepID=A0A8K0WR62_9HYPO|nr:Alpha/Beta hydrolase protein [Stachybotrys elegans]
MRGVHRASGIQLVLTLALAGSCQGQSVEPVWADIPASSTLEWVPCYNRRECARLEVPMNYQDPEGAKVTLAVIRLRATETDNYKGPVLFHSGGPHNSGVDWLATEDWARDLHRVVGHNHDIVAWDPRSFSRSTPRVSCWANEQRRNIWSATAPGLPTQYDDIAFIATLRQRSRIEHSACLDMMDETGILEYTSTTHGAHDVLALMTALGQDKLRFMGQSYGCVHATFFASMFPDKVERIVCDGNLSPPDLVSGDFIDQPLDIEPLLDWVAAQCATNSSCALHEDTAEAVRERINNIVINSRLSPVFVPTASVFDYVTQPPTQAVALGGLQSLVGNPYSNMPNIMRLLAAIEAGVTTTAEDQLESVQWPSAALFNDTRYRSPMDPDAGRKPFFNRYPQTEDWHSCNDLPEQEDDIVAFKERLDEAMTRGPIGGGLFSRFFGCIGRPRRPKGVYPGPFGGNTSYPILFTNARVDPSTSVRGAYNNHRIFPGSGLLVYEAYGHSMVFNTQCAVDHINKYFQDGTLPPANATCREEYTIAW